jgi:hypothetical protein
MANVLLKRLVRLLLILVVGIGIMFLAVYLSGWALAQADRGNETLLYACTACLMIGFALFRILGMRRLHRLLAYVFRLG